MRHQGDRFFYQSRGQFGPGNFPPGPFGPGHHGPGRGRRRRGDVRLALLMLLSIDGPANGYQLMQGLEERSDGRWRPSPGSVYPALSQLEDEGLIRSVKTEGDSGHSFELTDAGRAHLGERDEAKAPWEAQDEAENAWVGLRHAMISTVKAARQVAHDGDEQQIAKAVEMLNETRRGLYRLLAGDDA